jgi:hypothetical protein
VVLSAEENTHWRTSYPLGIGRTVHRWGALVPCSFAGGPISPWARSCHSSTPVTSTNWGWGLGTHWQDWEQPLQACIYTGNEETSHLKVSSREVATHR